MKIHWLKSGYFFWLKFESVNSCIHERLHDYEEQMWDVFFFTDVTKTVGIIFNPQMLFTTNCKKVDEHLKRTHTEHLSHAC